MYVYIYINIIEEIINIAVLAAFQNIIESSCMRSITDIFITYDIV